LFFYPSITHIFWDLDHTIWDYPTNARLTIYELFEKYAIQNLTHHSPSVFHEVYCRHNDLAWENYRKGIIDKATLRERRFKDTFIELGMGPHPFYEHFEKEFVEICPTKGHLMPGALEVLTQFNSRFEQHIINGFKETQGIKLQTSGIHHFFKTLTNSEDTGYQKPHPEIFKIAMERAGAKPENSVMIGDNYEADVLGAYDIGMKCVFYNPGVMAIENIPEGIVIITKLCELVDD
jgi:putative hydrolase of the HAD superfamily